MTETDHLTDINFSRSEDFLCRVCRCNDSIGKKFACSVEYLRNVFHLGCQYFDSGIFGNLFDEGLMQTKEHFVNPLCILCFSTVEKLFEMHEHLEKVQKVIADLVNSFTNEMLKNRGVKNIHTDDNLTDITVNESCAEIVNDWSTISNAVQSECLYIDSIKTEEIDDENNVSEFGFMDYFEFEGDKQKLGNNRNSIDPQLKQDTNLSHYGDDVCNFTNTNGCNESVLLKPLRVTLQRVHTKTIQSTPTTSSKPKSRTRQNISKRNTISSHPENIQVRNKKIENFSNSFLAQAKSSNTSNKTYKCRICEEIFNNLTVVRQHIQNFHPDDTTTSNIHLKRKNSIIETVYPCGICSLSFNTRRKLWYHKNEHSQELTCNVCGKVLKNRITLNGHMQTHLEINSFKFKQTLDRHFIRVHTDERPFKCHTCNKAFKLKHDVYKHNVKVHKAHVCEDYGKKYNTNTDLRNHRRQHTGDMFNCTLCDNNYITQFQLMKHVQIVHTKTETEN